MLKITTMSISLFLLLKLASGIDPPGNNFPLPYQESGPSSFSDPLKIVVQPANQTDCKGNKATFEVVAQGGNGAIHYQWKRKRPTDTAFSTFGAKDSTKLPVYNIGTGSEAPGGTQYQVTVYDDNNVETSAYALLTVNQITGISPVGVATFNLNQGENLSLHVLTSGNIPSSFRWIKKFGPNDWQDLIDDQTLSGSQNDQLNFTKISLADSGIYKVRVTFPTINGNQCTETSTLTRTLHVKPVIDTVPPIFINLIDETRYFCPDDIEQANWDDSTSDILPERKKKFQLDKFSEQFNIDFSHFSDNITPSADLILHWGIYKISGSPAPLKDESGMPLDNMTGQISLHPQNICFDDQINGSQPCQIIFWLEDEAGNISPDSHRYKIAVAILPRPDIQSDF
jgi:hypothetical protein